MDTKKTNAKDEDVIYSLTDHLYTSEELAAILRHTYTILAENWFKLLSLSNDTNDIEGTAEEMSESLYCLKTLIEKAENNNPNNQKALAWDAQE